MPDFFATEAAGGACSISDMIASGATAQESSLAREKRGVVYAMTPYGVLPHVPTFCVSCSKAGPLVIVDVVEDANWAGYSCLPCSEKYRDQLVATVVPDELFYEAVKQYCLEAFGRELLAHEQLAQLHDPNSGLSKLARSRRDPTASWNRH